MWIGYRRKIEGLIVLAASLPLIGGSIEGRVTNSVTGEPVSGVKVRFLDQHSVVHETGTDSSGVFQLSGLSDGAYRGEFSKDGFADGSGNSVAALAGDVAARVDARLYPWGGIRGRVVDQDGKPAARIRVEIDGGDDTAADENGEFAFRGLRPGSYALVAKPEPQTRIEGGERVGLVPIYYPSATQLADAAQIAVGWGAEVAGIEIRLRSVPVRRVTGVVLDEAGNPAAGATVKLMGRPALARRQLSSAMMMTPNAPTTITEGSAPAPALQTSKTRGDGTFEFEAVEGGEWRLSAELWAEEDKPLAGVGTVNVGDRDVEDATLRLSGPFAAPIAMDWGDAKPPDMARSYGWQPLRLTPVEGQLRLNIDPASNVGRINGIFPGRYLVTASEFGPGFYAAAVIWEGRDVLDQVVEVSAGMAALQVVYKHDQGSLRGTAENGEGATVFLLRRDPGDIVHYKKMRCGTGGAFEFDNVPPGDYYVMAARVDNDQPMDVESIVRSGEGVRIEAGEAASVNVRVN